VNRKCSGSPQLSYPGGGFIFKTPNLDSKGVESKTLVGLECEKHDS